MKRLRQRNLLWVSAVRSQRVRVCSSSWLLLREMAALFLGSGKSQPQGDRKGDEAHRVELNILRNPGLLPLGRGRIVAASFDMRTLGLTIDLRENHE